MQRYTPPPTTRYKLPTTGFSGIAHQAHGNQGGAVASDRWTARSPAVVTAGAGNHIENDCVNVSLAGHALNEELHETHYGLRMPAAPSGTKTGRVINRHRNDRAAGRNAPGARGIKRIARARGDDERRGLTGINRVLAIGSIDQGVGALLCRTHSLAGVGENRVSASQGGLGCAAFDLGAIDIGAAIVSGDTAFAVLAGHNSEVQQPWFADHATIGGAVVVVARTHDLGRITFNEPSAIAIAVRVGGSRVVWVAVGHHPRFYATGTKGNV